jgi:translation initiation factor IF-2
MSDELESKKPKATLIKHPKADVPAAPEPDAEKKKAVVVVKKKAVVKKVVVAHRPEGGQAAQPAAKPEPKPAPASGSSESRLTPEQLKAFAAKRPQEMRQVAPADRPKPEGLRIETGRPPREQRPYDRPQGDRPPSQWGNRPQGDRPQGDRPQGNYGPRPQGGPGGPRTYGDRPANQWGNRPQGDRPQGNYGPRPPQGGPGGPRTYADRPAGQWGGPRPQGGPGYGPRPGGPGYGPRPGGPGYGPRPGGPGYGPRPGGPGGAPPPDLSKSTQPKKFRSKKEKTYLKEKEELLDKANQAKKRAQAKANPVPKEVDIMEVVTVAELARKMNLKASALIGKLMAMGMMVTINEQIDAETAQILASEYGTEVKIISLYDETVIETEVDAPEDLEHRPPIVTIMGHVDHGKTKLLDAIRTTDVAAGEHGGITQHIGAYKVHHAKGDVTFLDTPGHEAFTLMRARGAQITDIVVLVVAANDGVMPQTLEAINHAKEAKVPIIVAINKVDLPEANPDRVRQQLSDYGLVPEPWGGTTMYVEISALKRIGLDELLDAILLQAEVMELKASRKRRAEGKVIESKIDQGRGVVATVLVQKGVLKVGDYFVGGVFPGKVRAMFDDHGNSVKEAGPSMPVEVLGFDGIPGAGDPFQVTESERDSKDFSEKRQELKKQEEAKNVKKVTLANLYSTIQAGEVQELKVIIKGDVHGSVEALQVALEKLSTAEVRLSCIHSGAGAIIEQDVTLAMASQAIIIGFHVRPTAKAQQLAEREKVEIRKYNIIYDAVEDIRQAMEGMLSPEVREEVIGQVEVRDTFKVPKIGLIAGCMVTQGKIKRTSFIHVVREGIQIYTGKVSSLRRFKDDAKEVSEGFECGVSVENYTDVQVGDVFEVIEQTKVAKKLGKTIAEVEAEAAKKAAQAKSPAS